MHIALVEMATGKIVAPVAWEPSLDRQITDMFAPMRDAARTYGCGPSKHGFVCSRAARHGMDIWDLRQQDMGLTFHQESGEFVSRFGGFRIEVADDMAEREASR